MNIVEYQRPAVAGVSKNELRALRALDEMERLALTQVAAARQRKREILLRYGISLADTIAGKVLVMRHTR